MKLWRRTSASVLLRLLVVAFACILCARVAPTTYLVTSYLEITAQWMATEVAKKEKNQTPKTVKLPCGCA